MIEIEVSLFGRFRRLGATPEQCRVRCEAGVPAGRIKSLLGAQLRCEDSFADSVLATNDRILRDDELIERSMTVALLPPVCGG